MLGILNGNIHSTVMCIRGHLEATASMGHACKRIPDYPFGSSGDDDSVRMGRCPGAGIGQALGHGVELVAAVEPPGEARQVALGVLGADMVVGAGQRGLDVAERGVDPAALAAPIAKRAPAATAQG